MTKEELRIVMNKDMLEGIQNPLSVGMTTIWKKSGLRKIKDAEGILVRKKNGIPMEGHTAVIADEYYKEITPYVKVYETLFKVIAGLSRGGVKLLSWIVLKKLEYGLDYVMFTMEEYIDEKESSKTAFYSAIDDLINNRIIARRESYPNVYWINFTMIFRGDRRHILAKYEKKTQKFKSN